MTAEVNRVTIPTMKLITHFCLLLAMTACSYSTEYPAEWPAISSISKGECIDVSGTYTNEGEVSFNDAEAEDSTAYSYEPPYLTSYFFDDTQHAAEANSVQLGQIGGEQMMVTAHMPNGGVMAVAERQGVDFTCQGNRIYISRAGNVSTVEAGRGKSVMILAKANDGSLIANVYLSDPALLDYIPVGASSSQWHRFTPLD